MPRKRLLKSDFLPYHVTGRANNREVFPVDPALTWRIFTNECYSITLVYGVEIHAFTLMPNHFHMLLTVPEFDLGKVMDVFMSNVTRTMNLFSGRSGHVFGGPYYWSLINSGSYYLHALKYVYRNPVRANLCGRVEEYPYSTLHGLVAGSHLPFPLYYPRSGHGASMFPEDYEKLMEWMNRSVAPKSLEAIRRGLRFKEFKVAIDLKTKKPMELDQEFMTHE